MVDFNAEATIGTPRTDILSVMILQRRYDLFEAIEQYRKAHFQGSQPAAYALRARLSTFFLEVRAALKNDLSSDEFRVLAGQVASEQEKDWSMALQTIDDWLYRKNLIRIDTRKAVDPRNIEEANKANGV